MVIEGKQYEEKEDAGKAIIDVCTRMTGSDAVLLGSYRGFSWCWPMTATATSTVLP